MALNACSVNLETPPKEMLKEFPVGRGESKFRFFDDQNTEAPFYPTSVRRTPDGQFFIQDYKNGVIQRFSKELQYLSTLSGFYMGIEVSEKFLIAYVSESNSNSADVFLIGADSLTKIARLELKFDDELSYLEAVYIDDDEIVFSANDSNRSYRFENGSLRDVSIKDLKNFSFTKNDVVNKSLGFLTPTSDGYIIEKKGERVIPVVTNRGKRDVNGIFGGRIFGIDKLGRRYIFDTYTGNRIGIANAKGDLIRALYLGDLGPTKFDIRFMKPCVSSEGDIYYIESTPERHRLYKITCTW